MSVSRKLSKAQRSSIHKRANGCCEYCRLPMQRTVPFHVDHVIPAKHGGSNEITNLCLACVNCNLYKSHDLTGFDPETDLITPLFNPRQHLWTEHFMIQPDMRIVGLTPEGRTTVRVLQMNLAERVKSRLVLADIGEYPCN